MIRRLLCLVGIHPDRFTVDGGRLELIDESKPTLTVVCEHCGKAISTQTGSHTGSGMIFMEWL